MILIQDEPVRRARKVYVLLDIDKVEKNVDFFFSQECVIYELSIEKELKMLNAKILIFFPQVLFDRYL